MAAAPPLTSRPKPSAYHVASCLGVLIWKMGDCTCLMGMANTSGSVDAEGRAREGGGWKGGAGWLRETQESEGLVGE